jgi:hypothetical protein
MEKNVFFKTVCRLSASRLEKIQSEFMWGPSEKVFYASDVTKLHQHGGKDERTLVISIGAIYVLRKSDLVAKYSVIDLGRVSFIEPNIFTIAFIGEHKQFTCQVSDAIAVGHLVLYLHKALFFRVESRPLKIESTPPKALAYPVFDARPSHALEMRMITLAHFYDTKFPLTSASLIAAWDACPTPTLRLCSDFQCGDASKAIAQALAWECDARSLILDCFSEPTLSVILQTLISMSRFLRSITLENYLTFCATDFFITSPDKSDLREITFWRCHPSVVINVITGLKKFTGRIGTLTIGHCQLSQPNFVLLLDLIGSLPCFLGLKTLRLEEGAVSTLDLELLAEFLSVPKIKSLTISGSSTDSALILQQLCPRLASVQYLCFANGKLNEVVHRMALSSQILYIDISGSHVSSAAFGAFLNQVMKKPRKQLLTLNMSDLVPNGNIINCFSVAEPQSVLSELNFSGNILKPAELSVLLNFLKSQRRLAHLNLSRCFREHGANSLKILGEFVIEVGLQGLEIGSDPEYPLGSAIIDFLAIIGAASPLHCLNMEKSGCGDRGLEALKIFVEQNSKLTSLSADGAGPQTGEVFRSVYATLSRLDRLQVPRADHAALVAATGVNFDLKGAILNKSPPKRLSVRLSEYEVLDTNATVMVQPMDALMRVMEGMTKSVKNPGVAGDMFVERGVFAIFQEALVASSLPKGGWKKAKEERLIELLNDFGNGEVVVEG